MPYYMRMGNVPHKRHTQFRRPDGALYQEEVIGAEGFSGISSIAYHIHPPTVVERVLEPIPFQVAYAEKDFLHHRHIKGFDVQVGGDWLGGRQYMMGNTRSRRWRWILRLYACCGRKTCKFRQTRGWSAG